MAKIALSVEDFEKLASKYPDIINPKRYYVVTDGAETLVLVPLKSSRHLHYYEIKARGESYERAKQFLENRGFTIVIGEVTFLPA